MKLFDETWVGELAARMSKDESFQKKAKGFDAVYQYVIKPPTGGSASAGFRFAIAMPEAKQVWMGDHAKPDFVMTTSYEVMHDVITGKTNAVIALTTRKAFVSGNLARLLRYTGAINRVVELMHGIPADGEPGFVAITG